MEVNRVLGRTLLFAAIFGMASVVSAEEGYITTDNSDDEKADTQFTSDAEGTSSADSPETAMEYAYQMMGPMFAPAGAFSPTVDFDINGYVNAGGMFNTRGTDYNMMSANSDNQFGLDGAYIAVEKKAQNGCGLVDWGFGADTMFGRDARFLQGYAGIDHDWSTGKASPNYNGFPINDEARENYGFAMPQLYGEASINYWTFKMGHFYSLMGYESARADQRFFYSLGRSFEVTPHTHTGALATYKGVKNMEWTLGWAAGENNTFDRKYGESLIIGSAKLMNGDRASLKYDFIAGDGAMAKQSGDLFRNDVVLSGKVTDRLETAFIFNYGKFDGGKGLTGRADWNQLDGSVADLMQYYGTDNLKYQTWGGYLFYTVNACWKVGSRMEWQKGSTDLLRNYTVDMENFELGFGANWTPMGNDMLTIRPEIRYDKAEAPYDGLNGRFGNLFAHEGQVSLGIDMLCKY